MKLRTIAKEHLSKEIQENNNPVKFSFGNGKGECIYQNTATIGKITLGTICPNEIKILNQVCKDNGQFLEKLTTIKFNNEIITIKDTYKFGEQAPQANDGSTSKRVHIFKKPLHGETRIQGKKRLTKNLPKNFIKAFLHFLESIKDQKNKELVDCKMKLILSKQKFNNSFIQQIVDDSDLEPYFSTFLKQFAPNWIENSKIRDKDIHLQAVKIFERLCQAQRDSKSGTGVLLQDYLQSFSDLSSSISVDSKELHESDKESIIANSSKNEDQQMQ